MVLVNLERKVEEQAINDECPKCGGELRQTYEDREPECWMCGFVDYSFVPNAKEKKSIIATGTHYLVRYIGNFPAMKDRIVQIRVTRGSGVAKIGHDTKCPFCARRMNAVALSIKRKQVSEDRYICSEGHRISLLQDKNGELGWK